MSGAGGAPFLIPCSASYGMETSSFDDRLRDGFSWSIARPPLPMLATAPNGFTRSYYNSATVTRRSYPPDPASPTPVPGATPEPAPTPSATPSATPLDGMGFDTRGGLPASNDAFGLNQIFHLFGDASQTPPANLPRTIATADVALFFDATASTHPSGGPLMASGIAGNTPNYIYYYDQAYPRPWGIEVRFWNATYSEYNGNGDNFVKVGTDSHGLSGAGPNGGPDADGGIDTDLFAILPSTGELVWVGQQKIRGLDLYARNVYHECVHKKLYDYVHDPTIGDADGDGLLDNTDSDSDGVPDNLEDDIGTDPLTFNSTGFSYGGDGEVFARMCERNLPVSDSDWANDGFNFSNPVAPNRCERVVEVLWPNYTSQGLNWVDTRSLVP